MFFNRRFSLIHLSFVIVVLALANAYPITAASPQFLNPTGVVSPTVTRSPTPARVAPSATREVSPTPTVVTQTSTRIPPTPTRTPIPLAPTATPLRAAPLVAPPDPPVLVSPPNGSTRGEDSPILTVQVSDVSSPSLTVNFYGRQCAPDFSLIALPDTQYYSESFPGIFTAQTQWIVNNQNSLNIPFVTQLGDIVNDNTSAAEWTNASTAMGKLEPPGIPYGILPGKWDGAPWDTTNYNNYFGVSRFQGRSYYGGHYSSANDNSYQFFTASGLSFIVVDLQYEPTTDNLNWANTVLQNNANRRAIVATFDLLDTTTPTPNFTASGAAIWNALKGNANIFLMLGASLDTEGFRQDTGPNGNVVYSLRQDYQNQPNGGNGWLRILRFSPATNQVNVKTYSPTLAQYWTPDNQFNLAYNMGPGCGAFQLLGTVTAASGSQASYTWANLLRNQYYEWYVTVSDGVNTVTSSTWWFWTTAPTAVSLASFTAQPRHDPAANDITLYWQTASEISTAGFNVYRSEHPDGPFRRMNDHLMPASPDPLMGGAYRYQDNSILTGQTYYYVIEDVALNGVNTRHGPIVVMASEGQVPQGLFGLLMVLFIGLLFTRVARAVKITSVISTESR